MQKNLFSSKEYQVILQARSLSILVIGDSCLDRFYYGTCERLSPEAPVPVLKFTKLEEMPGMAANVAENAKAFTDKVTLITQSELITKSRYIDQKSKQHIMRFDEEDPVESKIQNDIDVESFDVIIISDYCKGFLRELDTSKFSSKKHLYVDTKRSDVSSFHNCTIKINQNEYKQLQKETVNKSSDILVTMGANGALFKGISYETKPVDIFDVSGAGDTFLTAYAVHHTLTACEESSINFANKCSGLVVQKPGTFPITSVLLEEAKQKWKNQKN